MSESRGFWSQITKWARRFVARPVRELSRTGRITQTLWDAAQLQAQQRAHYQRIGELTIRLVREGKLENLGISRTLSKIDQIERILTRQELLLRSYQKRVDVSDVLGVEPPIQDKLEPV